MLRLMRTQPPSLKPTINKSLLRLMRIQPFSPKQTINNNLLRLAFAHNDKIITDSTMTGPVKDTFCEVSGGTICEVPSGTKCEVHGTICEVPGSIIL